MRSDDPRARLEGLAKEATTSLAALSRMLGRGPAYLQQWVRYGSPRVLAERDRRMLANFFGVSQAMLGGEEEVATWRIPRLDVTASAGPGTNIDDEALLGLDSISAATARALGLREVQAAIIRVAGDSMAPGLLDGDRLLVDQASRTPDARGGIYVIRLDGMLMVKRVRSSRNALVAGSDNPSVPPLPPGDIAVIGRAVWQMRKPL